MHRSNILIEFRSTVIHSLYKVTLSKDLTGLPPTPTDKLCHYLCCFLLLKCQHSPTTIYVSLLPHKPLSPLNGQGVESNRIHQKPVFIGNLQKWHKGNYFYQALTRAVTRALWQNGELSVPASPITTNSKVLQTCGTARQSLDLSWEKDRKAEAVICNLPLRILPLSLCLKTLLVCLQFQFYDPNVLDIN